MNTNKVISINILASFLMAALSFSSCSKYQEIVETTYPDQIIYMPTAVNGIYNVSGPENTYSVPTKGQLSGFYVEESIGKLNIPLGVHRGGIQRNGGFTVNIKADADTVMALINNGTLADIEMLPNDKYYIPPSVEVADGKDFSIFNLVIHLAFLKENMDKKFAVAVGITSSEREVNPILATTVVVFDASLLMPAE